MDIEKIANSLQNTKIDNLEKIAQSIRADDFQEYAKLFSYEIVKQKMENSDFEYLTLSTDNNSDYPYSLKTESGILIGVSPMKIIEKQGKNYLKDYARKVRKELSEYNGLIHFMPFQLNNKNLRSILEKEIDVAFVNMSYGENDVYRRFKTYGQCNW